MYTEHRAKHGGQCVSDEYESHMEGKDHHHYPPGPCHVRTPSPLYSTSCFITPHHANRRYDNRWTISPAFTDDDGYPVFHTIINKDSGPTSNHASQEEDLPVPNAPVNYDDPFPDHPSRALDILAFQLSQHLKGKWYNSLPKATASDPLHGMVSKSPNHPSWILINGLVLKRRGDDSVDCQYVPDEAGYEGSNLWSEIIRITYKQIAHMGVYKCIKYASKHLCWMSTRSAFKDYIRRWHPCQINKKPTTLPDGVVTVPPVPREPFSSFAIDFAGQFPNDNKKELILVVLDPFTGFTYLIPVSRNITALETANILIEIIFSVHDLPDLIVSDRDPKFTARVLM